MNGVLIVGGVNKPVVGDTLAPTNKAPLSVDVKSEKGAVSPETCSVSEVMLAEEIKPVATAESGATIVTLKRAPRFVGVVVVNW